MTLQPLLGRVPPRLVRWIGRAQFEYPLLGALVRKLEPYLTADQGTILRGVGRGLRFDSTGGFPGYLLGTSEGAEQEILTRFLQPGGVFYDIGAHIGFYATLGARLVGPHGRVFAFEPFPESARQASHNAALNGFEHVSVVTAAVGDRHGATVSLELGESSTQHRVSSISGDAAGVPVRVVSIDRWRAQTKAPPPSFVMIDVEGAELEVLRGMLETIADSRPPILCEVHWLGPEFAEFIAAELEPLGYEMRRLEGTGPTEFTRWHAVLEVGKPSTVSRAER